MTVLFSELLVPGWSDGPQGKIGLRNVTARSETITTGGAANFALPCHTVDPETFFSETPAQIAVAKALCGACPVKASCLEGALSRAEPCGIWGGELFESGRVVLAKRQPGRPRLQRADMELAG